jgi:hypothetical protein
MKATNFLIGFLLGLFTAIAGVILFLEIFTVGGIKSIATLKELGLLRQVITLGSTLNLAVFFIMIWRKKDMVAKGIILATITLAILTIML